MTKNTNNKNKIIAIIAIVLLTISGVITILPTAFAQTTLPGYTPMPDRDTSTVVGVSPHILESVKR